jgi:hypothetical protein
LEWTYSVIFAVLIPIALSCALPLLVAVIGRRVGRRFGSSQPTMGAGFGGSTQGVKAPDEAIQRTRPGGTADDRPAGRDEKPGRPPDADPPAGTLRPLRSDAPVLADFGTG